MFQHFPWKCVNARPDFLGSFHQLATLRGVCGESCVVTESRNILVLHWISHLVSFSSPYLGPGHRAAVSIGNPRLTSPPPLPATPLGGCQAVPESDEKCNVSTVFWVCPRIASWLDMPETPPWRLLGSILPRCTSHLCWLPWIGRSSRSTLRPSWIPELFSLFQRLSLDTVSRENSFQLLTFTITIIEM